MNDCVTHSDSFRITVQSLGAEVEDRMERGFGFKVSCGNWDLYFLRIHTWWLGSPQKVLDLGCL
jgi:hypothetical protein